MSHDRQETPKSTKQPKPYAGFDERGSFFRSAAPVENAVTRFVHSLREQVREKFLAPADAAGIVARGPAWIRSAFPLADQWSRIEHPWQWFAAPTRTSAEETVKRAVPHGDENALRDWLERAERFHGGPCRFDSMDFGPLEELGVTWRPGSLRCAVHGAADTSPEPADGWWTA